MYSLVPVSEHQHLSAIERYEAIFAQRLVGTLGILIGYDDMDDAPLESGEHTRGLHRYARSTQRLPQLGCSAIFSDDKSQILHFYSS